MMDFEKVREIGLRTKRQLILGEITMQGMYSVAVLPGVPGVPPPPPADQQVMFLRHIFIKFDCTISCFATI